LLRLVACWFARRLIRVALRESLRTPVRTRLLSRSRYQHAVAV